MSTFRLPCRRGPAGAAPISDAKWSGRPSGRRFNQLPRLLQLQHRCRGNARRRSQVPNTPNTLLPLSDDTHLCRGWATFWPGLPLQRDPVTLTPTIQTTMPAHGGLTTNLTDHRAPALPVVLQEVRHAAEVQPLRFSKLDPPAKWLFAVGTRQQPYGALVRSATDTHPGHGRPVNAHRYHRRSVVSLFSAGRAAYWHSGPLVASVIVVSQVAVGGLCLPCLRGWHVQRASAHGVGTPAYLSRSAAARPHTARTPTGAAVGMELCVFHRAPPARRATVCTERFLEWVPTRPATLTHELPKAVRHMVMILRIISLGFLHGNRFIWPGAGGQRAHDRRPLRDNPSPPSLYPLLRLGSISHERAGSTAVLVGPRHILGHVLGAAQGVLALALNSGVAALRAAVLSQAFAPMWLLATTAQAFQRAPPSPGVSVWTIHKLSVSVWIIHPSNLLAPVVV